LAAHAVKAFNVLGDEWHATRDRDGWRTKFALVGEHIGAELIGATLSEVEPGERLWPYHTHHSNEEWVIVVRGAPTLRTPEGEQTLAEGDVVCFRRGKEGAHQVINRTESPVRVLMLSTVNHRVSRQRQDPPERRERRRHLSRSARPEVDYWDGED
jgi:uncharacterized cupin superfamily protein